VDGFKDGADLMWYNPQTSNYWYVYTDGNKFFVSEDKKDSNIKIYRSDEKSKYSFVGSSKDGDSFFISKQDLSNNQHVPAFKVTQNKVQFQKILLWDVQKLQQHKKIILEHKKMTQLQSGGGGDRTSLPDKLLQRLTAGAGSRDRARTQADRIQSFINRTAAVKGSLRQLQEDAAHLISDLDFIDRELKRIQAANDKIGNILEQAQQKRAYQDLQRLQRRS
jgi:hypothetical protein